MDEAPWSKRNPGIPPRYRSLRERIETGADKALKKHNVKVLHRMTPDEKKARAKELRELADALEEDKS